MSLSSYKKVIYAALTGNAVLSSIKFVAAGFTGSSAMLSEGIHSLLDTGNIEAVHRGKDQTMFVVLF